MRAALEQEIAGELEAELDGELEGGAAGELEGEVALAGPSRLPLYEIIGPDSRRLVTNTRLAPFRYICHLEYNGRALCTGTLIGPSTVLTAGHCLAGRDPALMRVIPGRNGTLEPLPATRARTLQLAPGFASGTATDYGAIQLQDPVGNQVGFWSIAYRRTPIDPRGTSIGVPLPLPAGALRVNVSGYPGDKCILAGRPPQQLCGVQQWRAFDRTVRVRGGILEYLNDTFGGHSGSPVWVKRSPDRGGRVMVAIHISGDDVSTPVVANRGVLITPGVLANIRRWLALAPARPRRPIVLPPVVIQVLPFRVLDRFEFNSADVRPAHLPVIDHIARHVVARSRTRSPVRTIRMVGHTDSSGPAAYNLDLGRRRAAAVHQRLRAAIERLRPGLTRRLRMIVQSLGETRPAASEATPDGRARNRRVEVFTSSV